MTTKNRDTLRVFEDERLTHAFLRLPESLMRRALACSTPSHRSAYAAEVALATAILSCAPVRIENLYGIEIDRHIVAVGSGRAAKIHLVFPAHEVKNDAEIELPLSSSAAKLFHIFEKRAWPVIAGRGCPDLFPGMTGMKHKNGLGLAITRTIRLKLGVKVTPHQSRHLCGFLFLRQNPGEYATVRALLGHKCLQTTISSYAGMETVAAGKRFDEVVLTPPHGPKGPS